VNKKPIIASAFLLSVIIAADFAVAQKTLSFVTLDNFSPFAWKEDEQSKGIDVDVVNEMCQRLSVKCDITFRPWKRVLAETRWGEKDGGFSAFKTQEREVFAYFLDYPLHYSTYKIFVKKGKEFPFEKVDDLYGKIIGKNRGFNTGEEFDKATEEGRIRVEEATDAKANIRKLMAERIEALVGNYHETLLMLKQLGFSGQVIPLPLPIRKPRGAYLIISKSAKISNKAELINEMNNTLKNMYEDGTVERINSRYLQ